MNTFNDNRSYDYTNLQTEEREDYKYVVSLIKEGSSIIDLGCGNGSLMQKLIKEKNVKAEGIEISETGVEVCRNKGLKVNQGRIDQPLTYRDNSFDYSICNVTFQMVMFPEILMHEMKRISRYQIISFPNFAFYKNRLDLLFRGRMPVTTLFNFKWYNTGHIHLFSIKDFRQIIEETGGLKIEKHLFIRTNSIFKNLLMKISPNLFQLIPVILLKKVE